MIVFTKIKNFIINTIDRTFGIFKDIRNYFYLKRIINKNKDTEEWKKFNLRVGWSGRIYTIINLREEDFGEKNKEIIMVRFMEIAMPLFEYLNSLNLQEVITPKHTHIDGTISYLIVFSPLFHWLTLEWIVNKVFKLGILILIIYFLNSTFKLDILFSSLWNKFINLGILK